MDGQNESTWSFAIETKKYAMKKCWFIDESEVI